LSNTDTYSTIKGIIDNARMWGDYYSSWLYSPGQNLINGFQNGMNSVVWGLYNTAKTIANNVISTVKTILGINSPSKVFTEIGMFVD